MNVVKSKQPGLKLLSGLTPIDKEDLFSKLASAMTDMDCVTDRGLNLADMLAGIWEREKQGSTALGNGVIFPHARFAGLKELCVALAVLPTPLALREAPDQHPIRLACMLLIPEERPMEALKFMARLAGCIHDHASQKHFYDLVEKGNKEKVLSLLNLNEKKSLAAADIMRPWRCSVNREMPLKEATRLMQEMNASTVPVLENGVLIGELSCTSLFQLGIPDFFSQLKSVDFIRYFDPFEKYFSIEAQALVKDVMKPPVAVFREDATLIEIVFAMTVKNYPLLYVVNARRELLGVIDHELLLQRIINL